MYQKIFKRLFDIILSLILILLLFPLMVFIFFAVWYFIGFPIFKHDRPGLKNKIFTLYKFKTLYDASQNISEKKRQSKFGNFLRRTSLDELPQLFNILFNNMSFVGPRPLLIKYLSFNSFKNHERSMCKPGLTCLAQIQTFKNFGIKKRRKSKWNTQFSLDKEYYYRMSFALDMIILYKTFLEFIKFKKIDYNNETKLLDKHFK